jgi:putative transposon-encoded protein
MKITVKKEIEVPNYTETIVKPFGKYGAHVILSKYWIGKKVKVALIGGEK